MKICYVISTAEVAGGANRSLLDLIGLVKNAGHECVVLGPANGTIAEELKKLNIDYRVIPYKSSVRFGSFIRNATKYAYNIWKKRDIIRFFREEEIDLVHNNSLPTLIGMEAAYSSDIPYICHIRENIWSGLGMEFIKDSDAKKIIKNAGANIVISNFIERAYKQFEPDADYSVINDGIRISDYYENKEIFSDSKVRVGIVGVVNPQKGQGDAIKALELLRNKGYDQIQLEIIGKDGTWCGTKKYATQIKDYVNEKKLSFVTFIPPISDCKELRNIRKKHDINLICSSAEGLGRTTIESMLSGSLTIAANAGATPEILTHMEQGLLYESGNIEDLANKIEYAIRNKQLMRTIAKCGQEYAANRFSIENYASRVLEIYSRVLGSEKDCR